MSENWKTCDGSALEYAARYGEAGSDWAGVHVSRRQAIVRLGLGALGLGLAGSALAQATFRAAKKPGHTLVVVFLRGGADGLSLVVPHFEPDYARARPQLALSERQTKPLDSRFSMHPGMPGLLEIWQEGHLSIVHAVGSSDTTRSHFEAMRTMETGAFDGRRHTGGGWLARFLTESDAMESTLRAVSFGGMLPESLRGYPPAMALGRLDDFRLQVPEGVAQDGEWLNDLAKLYTGPKDLLAEAGHETLGVLKMLRDRPKGQAAQGAAYPETEFGRSLKDVAALVHADLGLEVACVDHGIWDTHAAQGTTEGWIANNVGDLSAGLHAFWQDLGERRKNVTVVVQTEFGRRVNENVVLGTDHGRSSVFMVLDTKARGGKVLGDWPGLKPDQLDEEGDLRVGTDYRRLLAGVLKSRMSPVSVQKVFPELTETEVNVVN